MVHKACWGIAGITGHCWDRSKTVHGASHVASSTAPSSSHGNGGAAGRSGRVGSSGAVHENRSPQKTTAKLDNFRARTPTGIEFIIRVLADEEIWQRASIWSAVSHPVWQAHAREYSVLRTSDDVVKYCRAYSKGRKVPSAVAQGGVESGRHKHKQVVRTVSIWLARSR